MKRYTGVSISALYKLLDLFFIDAGADNTNTADNRGGAVSYVRLTGNVIKVDPLAVLCGNYSLCAEDHTVVALVESLENGGNALCGEFLGGFYTVAGEYLISMVVMVMIMAAAIAVLVMIVVMMIMAAAITVLVVIVVVMLVLVAAAITVLGVIVVVMLVLVATAIAVLVMIVVMMLVLVATAVAVLVMIVAMMLVLVTTAVAVLIMIVVVMLVLVATAITVLIMIVVVMVMVLMIVLELLKILCEGVALFHSGENILAVDVGPGSGNDNRLGIMLTYELYCLLNLECLSNVGVREDNGGCVLNLIVEELTEVFHIHLALTCIDNGGEAVELCSFGFNTANCTDNVGKLANTRGLDDYSVGVVLFENLCKRLGKVTNE